MITFPSNQIIIFKSELTEYAYKRYAYKKKHAFIVLVYVSYQGFYIEIDETFNGHNTKFVDVFYVGFEEPWARTTQTMDQQKVRTKVIIYRTLSSFIGRFHLSLVCFKTKMFFFA